MEVIAIERPELPRRNYLSLLTSIGLYLIVSPLSTYNTFAMFGVVESRYVPVQLAITAVMIFFAIIASKPLSYHCLNHNTHKYKKFWIAGFYVIGPPVLYAYYHFHLKR